MQTMPTETLNDIAMHTLAADGPLLASERDALDLIGEHGDAEVIVVPESRLAPAFFELKTKLAGEFFQRLQNYRLRLVVPGDISERMAASRSLNDFVVETNRVGHHLFAPNCETLLARLGRTTGR